jgi:SAM-dependent methyltransferase
MTDDTFDQESWERRWEQALREHPGRVAARTPNAHLVAEVGDIYPGRALDAGCGHGVEAIWLAAAGWQVTAVDFSRTALEHGRSTARAVGQEVADRITWVEGDLGSWTPAPQAFDLVSCLYVHVAGSVGEFVHRLGTGVDSGGTLFMVGHLPADPATGKPTPAAGQVQVSVDAAVGALDPQQWEFTVAKDRVRAESGTGVDAVIRAVHQTRFNAAEPSGQGVDSFANPASRSSSGSDVAGGASGQLDAP